ncbi:MAG: SDR family NAD(P)-dependent oxidoreductase [Hyphomonadaceae bacterium]
MASTQLFAFGFGYVAGFLAERLAAQGVSCAGTVRSEDSAAPLRERGWDVPIWPGEGVSPPRGADWLVSVPPDAEGCPVFRTFQAGAGSARSLSYLSTTGAYGDLQGGWAFEETPVKPLSREATNRARAEEQWLSLGAMVFRLPGLYGPGRSAIERVREPGARRIVKAGQVFSRIHVTDLAALLELAITRVKRGEVFNVCDDEPTPADEVLAYAAGLLGVEPPPAVAFEQAGLSEAARRFYAECKRVSNAKAKATFGWRPAFATYREGLADCLARMVAS